MGKCRKKPGLLLAAIFVMIISYAQEAVPLEIIGTASQNNRASNNLLQYGVGKQLPPGYEQETLEALSHFPELKNVRIRFRIKKSFATLKTRPSFLSMFMPKGHRSYIITISNKTTTPLMPLMFMHLSKEARTGVIGHELSHVLDFSKKNDWQCLTMAVGHLSPRYLDHFEYNTDLICIQHGLGKDLEAWSSYIRKTMHTVFWRGADYVHKGDTKYERYMNPATIEKHLSGSNKAASGGK
jgi:hypothetical protein